jgi:DAK2 domain fusion protein YloV
MAPRTSLDAASLRAVMTCYAQALRAHRGDLNRLNVYPVPDGDTGTNMALTLESVVAELGEVGEDMAEVCRALAHGSLMGARGNSGVILSQIIRGLCEVFAERDEIDAGALARGLRGAADAAYGAVLRPVEGTILSVARAAGDAALDVANAVARDTGPGGPLLVDVAEAAKTAAAAALARTPEQLPVLRDAGVVDAGGTGYVLLCDAFLHVIDGRVMPEPAEPVDAEPALLASGAAGTVGECRYEVMFFLHAADEHVPGFKAQWMDVGDSIVVVGGDGLYNCHIHTDDIGAAIEAGIAAGRPAKIRVTDLREEVEERAWVREAAAVPPAALAPHVTTAVVAVGAGDGVVRLLRSLGAHDVVAGGQSMNPSTADLLVAVERIDADGIVILPNNKNIVPVAQQVCTQAQLPVHVVATTSVPEGLAALVAYDPEASAASNHDAMSAAAGGVVAGEVTVAVRDANTPAGAVRNGDHLGIGPSGIASIAATAADAAVGLLGELIDDEHEIVTVITGADASPDDTAKIGAWLEAEHPDLQVELHVGGQPLYSYYFGVE